MTEYSNKGPNEAQIIQRLKASLLPDVVRGMAEHYKPLIQQGRESGEVSDEQMVEALKKGLQEDLRLSEAQRGSHGLLEYEIFQRHGIRISSSDIYLQIVREHIEILESDGLEGFLNALE